MTKRRFTPAYPAELRDRGVRLFCENRADYTSDSAAYRAIAPKLGCSPDSLRVWCQQSERDAGQRAGLTTAEKDRSEPLKAPLMVWMAPASGIAMCHAGCCRNIHLREPSMDQPITIGLDLAKSVFQVHGVCADGRVVLRRQLRRGQVLTFFSRMEPCLIGTEACSGAHYWARELSALGHEVRLMPAAYVKPYVKRGSEAGKNSIQ